MHIHWHKYQYTLHENWMMHIDVRECRCGSMKIVTGRGYSTDKILHDLQKYHDTRTS